MVTSHTINTNLFIRFHVFVFPVIKRNEDSQTVFYTRVSLLTLKNSPTIVVVI